MTRFCDEGHTEPTALLDAAASRRGLQAVVADALAIGGRPRDRAPVTVTDAPRGSAR